MNKRKGKLIWATGISGCGKKGYLENWKQHCETYGKGVKVYHVGQMMLKWARTNNVHITPAKVLNTPAQTLNALRGAVFEYILGRLDRDFEEYDTVVISVHALFFWKKHYTIAFNASYIRRFDPDMFVCFIEAGENILDRLNAREQWQGQDLTEQDVLLWQNNEVIITQTFPDWLGGHKKCFVVPVQQPARTLYCPVFEPWRPIVYAQMPITHLEPEELDKVREFIGKLRKYFVVFDPLTIETGKVSEACDGHALTRHYQTVIRDNNWFLGQCDISIAYFVRVVFTAGVIDELREAADTNKESWVIFPGYHSPFLSFRAHQRIFQDQDELFRFIENVYMPKVYAKWGIKK